MSYIERNLSGGGEPVLETQLRNPSKMGRVVGHERAAMSLGNGGDQQVCIVKPGSLGL